MTFPELFKAATGHDPYLYQCRLACGTGADFARHETLKQGNSCHSQLIDIPTGLGKTAAVVLAWLWNRLRQFQNSNFESQIPSSKGDAWPRRLVYCLPMRTLVEQTRDSVGLWLKNLSGKAAELGITGPALEELTWLMEHSPIILMGGEEPDAARRDWDLYPEKPAILIGTQDMLLSRALNRGYGMSRYRWPMHFGLLNNDCLWVMDETQLMGPGLATACQLEAFRADASQGFHSYGGSGSVTWYMSATNNPEHLKTREWRDVQRPDEFEFGLTDGEIAATSGEVHTRRFASKNIELQKNSSFEDDNGRNSLIQDILERHIKMLKELENESNLPPRTLIICNTVDRAFAVHAAISKQLPNECDLVLLHSRFRPPERRAQMERLTNFDPKKFTGGQIVVSTQVIEAGVDISSGILWTEIAPLASLVQRLGRLNRKGEFNQSPWQPVAIIVGVGVQAASQREKTEDKEKREKENTKRCLPYELPACENAWESLATLNGNASPANLEMIRDAIAASLPRCPYSLQRHELLDFFDTDANLSLGFTDVSPFVRGLDNDTDLHVLWRESWIQEDGEIGTGQPGFTPDFQRDELCPVPISKAKAAMDILNQGWIWRGKESGWISVRDAGLAPGMTILLPTEAGGYSSETGWTGDKNNKPLPHYSPSQYPSDEEQLSLLAHGWQSIAVHTGSVARELGELLRHLLANEESERNALTLAAQWHDLGKFHRRWRWAALRALLKAGVPKDRIKPHLPLAKFSLSESPKLEGKHGDELKHEVRRLARSFRPGLAHEVASALAFRQAEQARLGLPRNTNLASLLAEYVIMSHHGRVRKVLRDEIPRNPKDAKDANSVRGISDGDPLPAVQINGATYGCESLSTDCRKMGRSPDGHESYTRGVLRLLEHYGPFRLAFFEAVFRAADMRASILASQQP